MTEREQIVHTFTADGLTLDGVVLLPDFQAASQVGVVWIHGGASNFYHRQYLAIGRSLALRGHTFVSCNTRGHDGFALLERAEEVVLGGASFERFDESPLDIRAWIDSALSRGSRRILLAGHSLEAAKVVHYQPHHADERVFGIVAAAPAVGGRSQPERLAMAQAMIGEGRETDLLPRPEGSPAWNLISAQTMASRDQLVVPAFDPAGPILSRLRCPLLVIEDGEEPLPLGWLTELRTAGGAPAGAETTAVAGTDHDFTGHHGRVAKLIDGWIRALDERRTSPMVASP